MTPTSYCSGRQLLSRLLSGRSEPIIVLYPHFILMGSIYITAALPGKYLSDCTWTHPVICLERQAQHGDNQILAHNYRHRAVRSLDHVRPSH